MSELQLGLAAIGVMVVVAVLAYNKWQEMRYRRQAEQAFGPGHDDVLMEPPKSGLQTAGNNAGRTTPDAIPTRIEPVMEADPDSIGQAHASAAGSAGELLETPSKVEPDTSMEPAILSELLDHIIEFTSIAEMDGTRVIGRAGELLQNFSKPIFIESFHSGLRDWVSLHHGMSSSRVRVGMQLVDRRGAASAEEIERFSQAVKLLAENHGAECNASDHSAIAQARDLDRFCGEVDVQIAINVLSTDAPFTGPQLREFAETRGFTLDDDGRFRCRDAQGRDVCILQNAQNAAFVRGSLETMATSAVTFELDVPRGPGRAQALDDCIAIAQQLAATLQGRLADDNGAVLTSAGLSAIRSQLEPLYATMAAKGIPAGSPLALRLFS